MAGISDKTLDRLRRYSQLTGSGFDELIDRFIDFFEKHESRNTAETSARQTGTLGPDALMDASKMPDLRHTSARGKFGDRIFQNWNDLVRVAHAEAYRQVASFDKVREMTSARIRPGKHEDEGFHFVPEAQMSVQGVDANRAWKIAVSLAQELGESIIATVEWRNTPQAARPGKKFQFVWRGSSPTSDILERVEGS